MSDPDIKKITHGGGFLALFGLPFLGMGLLLVFLFLSPPDGMKTSGEPWVGALVGGVFALVGAGFVFGRSGTILDRRRRTLTSWWGLLVPFFSTPYQIGRDAHVIVTREVRRSKNSTYIVFPVLIRGEGLSVSGGMSRDFDESRRMAEETAKFFGLAIHDLTGSEEVVREAGTLDESVQARARRLHIATPLPAQPPRAVCTIQYGGPRSTSVIEIPPAGIAGAPVAGLIGALILAGFVLFGFLRPMLEDGFGVENWFFVGFIGLFFLALPVGGALLAMLRAATSRQRVTVSPAGVQIRKQGFFGVRTLDFPAPEIEEVETTGSKTDNPDTLAEQVLRDSGNLSLKHREQLRRVAPKLIGAAKFLGQYNIDAGSVVVRTDRGSVELGESLVRAEKVWLRNAIVHMLTSDVTGTPASPAPSPPRARPAAREMPAAAPVPDDSMQPGRVQRKSGGAWAVSLVGLAALIFVLYQNGVLDRFLPGTTDEAAAPSESPRTAERRTAQPDRVSPPAKKDAFAETDQMLQQSLATAEQAYGPNHPAIAIVLYQMGVNDQTNKRPKEQEQVWLRALAILQQSPKNDLAELGGSIDKEVVARALGDFYWDQYKYPESYFHYDLAYRLTEDVDISDAERNRRLASNSAGIMATACTLGKWEIADYAMVELKERIKTVSPEEQKRLDYWVRTGEPRLKKRKC
ncbi:MAG: hypothetical protein HYY48_10400 [Gammaproteobacteria bacterium]|nr:hypothetical protein [Gammaproteobacteria bacterium]